MKIVTVVGARPQFIKAAPVCLALREAGHEEVLVHTGQHYDRSMSQIFFDELGIPEPDINLGVGSGPHGAQTGRMLAEVERVLLREGPDRVLVYGDTNSTLAGALAACKLNIPVAHVEAGLRSFNREMPEEHNRVLADHCADLLFCPTRTAVDNLAAEGITKGVFLVGDTMYDALLRFAEIARQRSSVLRELELEPGGYLLVTVHRPANTDSDSNLRSILAALTEVDEPVVFPAHPRTRQRIEQSDELRRLTRVAARLRMTGPVGYLDMLMLERHARMILTDSGGIQKEAYFFGVPCLTLRQETEWVETVEAGFNVLVGSDAGSIVEQVSIMRTPESERRAFGEGDAGKRIVKILGEMFHSRSLA